MKWVPVGLVALASMAVAQNDKPPVDLFRTVRPQILLTIRRDPNGSRADLIEARSVDANYPAEQMRAQILELGRLLNSEPPGLFIERHALDGAAATMTSIKASCAVDNLIDRETRKFHLTEIVRAFAGAPAPNTVTGLAIQFIGEQPRRDTLLSFGLEGDPVLVQASYDPTFNCVEYRVKLNTQKPGEIEIPEGAEQKVRPTPSTVANKGFDWTIWGLILVAAVAVGALVYSLLVRSTSSKRS
jgi:hypothetical protein